ncbi:MAG: AAA family ATPase [Clostridia bacterium]|nr:AAA family ATPase [Clostridia bacterium]
MDKKTLEQEKKYLSKVFKEIDTVKAKNSKRIQKNKESIDSHKRFFADSYYDLHSGDGDEFANEDEFASVNIQIENLEKHNEMFEKENKRLTKQKKNPYFGRFDFTSEKETLPQPYYIGLGLVQTENKENLIYDWRADICSLYYDDSLGKTSYTCPDGVIKGETTLKRQYKIENGELSYYIDSNMVIDDDILMEQLSKNATSKMHEIVSTIQKEQNKLIRAEDFQNTIVQGVAGSGKTSIAMHRVSYLLYKYRNTLKSEDILILSPSEVFSDYINEVLPSLGEEKSFSTTFTSMAKRLLSDEFETREELLERVIGHGTQKDFENIAIKSSFEFLEELKNFLKNDLCNLFIPKTLSFGEVVIPKEELSDIYFVRLKSLPVHKRIEVLAEHINENFSVPEECKADFLKRTKKVLYQKFLTTDVLKIYNLFLSSQELDEIEKVGAYDVAPMLLIKEALLGLKNTYEAKYVVVDEMQDYTPCHIHLFDKIWKCSKLYLGDINQSIDRTLPQSYLTNLAKLCKAKVKYLNKSYRSTLQISLFSQKILGKHIANNVNRNGEAVEFVKTKNCVNELERIVSKMEDKKQSVAIICKTNEQIKLLQKQSGVLKKFKQLNGNKSAGRKIITTPAQAKGVEFDCVIIPFADSTTYKNELDRNLLYVSSTRALHKLFFVCDKRPCKFLTKSI